MTEYRKAKAILDAEAEIGHRVRADLKKTTHSWAEMYVYLAEKTM